LLGTFEIPLRVAGIGDPLTRRDGLFGPFFTRVLAALVASPCTAPFMGTALGVAFVQPAIVAAAIFLALGTGFAAPLMAIAFVPGINRIIPRPGAWMMRLRQFLAFPMFATAIWLAWVLRQQAGPDGIVLALSIALAAEFLLWMGQLLHRHWRPALAILAIVGLVGAAPLIGD